MIVEENYAKKTRKVDDNLKDKSEEVVYKNLEKIKLNEENNEARNFYRERFFESENEKRNKKQDNIKTYFFVTIIFLLGFLIGIICFKNLINDEEIKDCVKERANQGHDLRANIAKGSDKAQPDLNQGDDNSLTEN